MRVLLSPTLSNQNGNFQIHNLVCFNIIKYYINFVCFYVDYYQWNNIDANQDMNFTAKEKQIALFTIGSGIWKTIIVGKKWNGEKYGIITNARVHKGTRRLVKCNAYVHGL